MAVISKSSRVCETCGGRSIGFQPVWLAGVSPADAARKMLAGPTDKMSVPRLNEELRYLSRAMAAA
jgi:hypothetical protein